MSTSREVLLWIIGALALLALAGPAPSVATWLLVIIIVGLVLGNWSTYSAYLTGGGFTGLTATKTATKGAASA